MGRWDSEDKIIVDFFSELGADSENNPYLRDKKKGLELVGKILSINKENDNKAKELKKIDTIIDVGLLGNLYKVQLKNEASLQLRLVQLSDRLLEEKKYKILRNKSVVGIGGKFSAGKSKFINSLLNASEELLPEDQNPTTSIPTYIVQAPSEKINAYTFKNDEVLLDVEAMQALTHKFYKKYSMGFASFISCMIIMKPDVPYKNLVFLDTPGYNRADIVSGTKVQKEISDENRAYEQLRTADYLIWLLDIENGELSESDIAFIGKLNLENPILIVANKADKQVDSDIQATVDKINKTVKEARINCFAVTAYSSRDKEEWGNNAFIAEYLSKAQRKKKNKEDILTQVDFIEKQIESDINEKIKMKIAERNELSNQLFQFDDIMGIRSLVEIYGETMEIIRDMKACKVDYDRTVKKLNTFLERHFERKK